MRLSLKPSVVVSPCDDGALAYDIESGQLHRLNPLAALIVELTSAQRSQEDILAEVAPLLGASAAVGCEAWIAQAIAEGLLIDATVATAPPSADELRRISTELRRTDHVLAAFLCQQQAVEIDSSDPQQWYRLGELAHIVGRRVEAREAYEEYQRACPQDVEVEHLLIALRDASPPPRASNTCIEHIYSYFASFYDRNMCEELEYQAPKFLSEALAMALSGRKDLIALDAGCGTGLFGLAKKTSHAVPCRGRSFRSDDRSGTPARHAWLYGRTRRRVAIYFHRLRTIHAPSESPARRGRCRGLPCGDPSRRSAPV